MTLFCEKDIVSTSKSEKTDIEIILYITYDIDACIKERHLKFPKMMKTHNSNILTVS